MANQWKAESTGNLSKLAARVIATRTRILQLLCAAAVGLFFFVEAAHAQTGPCPDGQSNCILLNEIYPNGQVYVYYDDGTPASVPRVGFLQNYPTTAPIPASGGGAGGGEGAACISGNTDTLYTVNRTGVVNTFNLTSGDFIQSLPIPGATTIGSVVVNAAGTIVYAGVANSPEGIYSLLPSSTGLTLGVNTPALGGDLTIGSVGASAGYVFSDSSQMVGSGVTQYKPAPLALGIMRLLTTA